MREELSDWRTFAGPITIALGVVVSCGLIVPDEPSV
jgi:hypothetical protein